MKKFYPPLVIILTLSLIIVAGCKSLPNYNNYNNEILQAHLIDANRANTIKSEYDSKRLQPLQPILNDIYGNGFQDTEFIWVPLKKLEAYVKYIKAIDKANPNHDVSGVRFYFAAYPNETSERYPGQQTGFMVPTVRTGYNSPFEPMKHLPFEVIPNNANMPLTGQFQILDSLMLDLDNKNRMGNYKSRSENRRRVQSRSSQLNSSSNVTNAAAAAQEDNVTKTVLNEFNLAPPPKDDD
jgi:hypothetical protein